MGQGRTARTGLTIVGVHSPEFSFEKDAGNVEAAIAQNGIEYPVAQDNEMATWNAWSNQYWPAEYLIDATRPRPLRATSARASTTRPRRRSARCCRRRAPQRLRRRRQAGPHLRPDRADDAGDLPRHRARGALPARPVAPPGTATYRTYGGQLPDSHFSLGGTWTLTGESATAGPDASLTARVVGKDVYLVLGRPRAPCR